MASDKPCKTRDTLFVLLGLDGLIKGLVSVGLFTGGEAAFGILVGFFALLDGLAIFLITQNDRNGALLAGTMALFSLGIGVLSGPLNAIITIILNLWILSLANTEYKHLTS